MLNLPEWYRRQDWGLRRDPALDNVTVTTRGMDKEEITAWNEFFFGTGGGVMLELGAMNGQNFSVSSFFEESADWRSILIEANPTLSSQIFANRPNAISFNAAICDQVRTVHYFDEDAGGLLSGGSAIMEFKFGEGQDYEKMEGNPKVTKILCVPLSHLLSPLGIRHINFFLLDVEGGELSILKRVDFDQIKFDVIAVETDRGNLGADETAKYVDEVIELLRGKGYSLWERKLGRNSWFMSPDFVPFNASLIFV